MELFLIDGTYELFRHYYAVPSARDKQGREVAAVRGVEPNDAVRWEAHRQWRDRSVSTDFQRGAGAGKFPWEGR